MNDKLQNVGVIPLCDYEKNNHLSSLISGCVCVLLFLNGFKFLEQSFQLERNG